MDTLKIDRAFLREVPESREAAAIITAILALARALGRSTVAEGVETEAQRAFLIEQQCPLPPGLPARPADARRRGRGAHGRGARRRLTGCAPAMGWRVTVRNGPRVEKHRAEDLAAALDLVEREGRALAAGPGPRRRCGCASASSRPQQQVAGRVELQRAGRAGRASTCAATATRRRGRAGVRRQVVEQEGRESPYAALRRVLGSAQSTSVEP